MTALIIEPYRWAERQLLEADIIPRLHSLGVMLSLFYSTAERHNRRNALILSKDCLGKSPLLESFRHSSWAIEETTILLTDVVMVHISMIMLRHIAGCGYVLHDEELNFITVPMLHAKSVQSFSQGGGGGGADIVEVSPLRYNSGRIVLAAINQFGIISLNIKPRVNNSAPM